MAPHGKAHKITVWLSDDEYNRLAQHKYRVSAAGENATVAGIIRAGMRLIFDGIDAVADGKVVGIARGRHQRTTQVLIAPASLGVRVTRARAGEVRK